MKKKVMAVLLAGMMVLAAGCGKSNNVALGEYKGLAVTSVSQATVDEKIAEVLASFTELAVVDRAAAEGDTVNINYVGLKDGVAFDGGTDDSEEGFDLELGSNSFIDGFEDGLIGAVAGEQRDLNLTFPENYGNEELNGQAVVFQVTVNSVKEAIVPEMTDAFVAENFPKYPTVAEYTTALHDALNQQSYYEQITEQIMANCEVKKYDEAKVEEEKKGFLEYYNAYAEEYAAYFGMDAQTVLQYMFGFSTTEELEDFAKEQAYEVVKHSMILNAIAEEEKLELTDEEYTERVADYAASYGYEEKVDEFVEQYGEEAIREVLLMEYVMEFLIKEAIVSEID